MKNLIPSMASFVKIVALRQPASSKGDWDRVARQLRHAIAQERPSEIRALVERHGPAVAQLDFAPEVVDRGLRGLEWKGRPIKACEKKEFIAGLKILWPHADKIAFNGFGQTALLSALDDGHLASARVMLDGSDLLARDSQGNGVIANLFRQMDRVAHNDTLDEALTRDALMMLFTVLARAEKLPFEQSHEIFKSALRNGKIAVGGDVFGYGALSQPTQEILKNMGFWRALGTSGPKHADVDALLQEFGCEPQPEPIQEVFAQWDAWLIQQEVDRAREPRVNSASGDGTPEATEGLREGTAGTRPMAALPLSSESPPRTRPKTKRL